MVGDRSKGNDLERAYASLSQLHSHQSLVSLEEDSPIPGVSKIRALFLDSGLHETSLHQFSFGAISATKRFRPKKPAIRSFRKMPQTPEPTEVGSEHTKQTLNGQSHRTASFLLPELRANLVFQRTWPHRTNLEPTPRLWSTLVRPGDRISPQNHVLPALVAIVGHHGRAESCPLLGYIQLVVRPKGS